MRKAETKLSITDVDDDPITRDVLAALFESEGFQVRTFADGKSFLAEAGTLRPDCLLLDMYMPVLSGLDVLQAIGGTGYYPAPVVVISALGDVPIAVAAVKAGAYDFIEKPFDPKVLVQRVKEAVTAARAPAQPVERTAAARRFRGAEALTARETEVLEQIIQGASSKEAGRRLRISQRTVETHRAQIMEKLGAHNTADLIRIVLSDDEHM